MQFPESWLREFCNPDISTEQLADLLTMAGLEVEEIHHAAPAFDGVVVGEIKEAVQHPNADRLRVCQVDVGAADLLTIVCGAPNARAGLRVPVATVGAHLPAKEDGKPLHIKVGKLRGVQSFGMLCSANELGIDDNHGGLLELDPETAIGQDIRQALLLDDAVFTLKLTPNLAHCQSVYGIAREVSALTGAPLAPLAIAAAKTLSADVLPVKISAPDLCGRYSGRLVRDVDLQAKTPEWMVARLERCGQRAVAPLVDISNYVMFELGQPSHIFDLDKVQGGIDVRWAREGEALELLNGTSVKLDPNVGVIADAQGVESLAGIMGGNATAVSDATRNIYIEAAFFWPEAIAGRSRRFNFSTEAGYRFERGVDPARTTQAIERITQLVCEICGTESTVCGPITDDTPNIPSRPPVTLRVARATKVIGMPVTQEQCATVFTRLGLAFTEGKGTLEVTPPSWRFDLQIEEDLIEEVVRVIGYDKLPDTPPQASLVARVRPEAQRGRTAIRHMAADLGYLETINFSFVPRRWEEELAGNPEPIKVLNPIASELEVMRSSLVGSLVAALKLNLDRHASRVKLFEIGEAFSRDASVPDSGTTVAGVRQVRRIAGIAYGPVAPLQWGQSERRVDFFDVKGDVQTLLFPRQATFVAAAHPALHPGRCAQVFLGSKAVGFVGELHPKWRQGYGLAQAPVLFELDLEALSEPGIPQFQTISRYPSVQRDLAIIVPESVSYGQVQTEAQSVDHDGLIRSIVLFDVYRPKGDAVPSDVPQGHKSLALRLDIADSQGTLTDDRIDLVVDTLLKQLGASLGARLRG